MNSASHVNHLLVHVRFVHVVRYTEHIASIIVNSFAQLLYSEAVLKCWGFISLFLKQIDIILEVLIGVRLEIGEKGYIVVMLKGVTERERVQIGTLRFLIFIDITRDVVLIVVIVRLYIRKG